MIPARAGSITPRAVHQVFECFPAPVPGDVAGHIGADRFRVAVGGAMRCHCHLGVRPQCAVLRQRLGHEDVECCAVKLARIEGREAWVVPIGDSVRVAEILDAIQCSAHLP